MIFKNNIRRMLFLAVYTLVVAVLIINTVKHKLVIDLIYTIIFTFVYGIANINVLKDMILGMCVGGGLFFTITLLGGLVAGKEAMGLGDVKFMGAVGLYLGASVTAEVSFLAFLLAAVISIVVIIVRKFIIKSTDDEIPFGPFLSLAALLCIFLPHNVVFSTFADMCRMLSSMIVTLIMG